jgi:hypothetical protein
MFVQNLEPVEADIGNSVILSCDVDGNPTPEIIWIFDSTEQVSLNDDID